MRKNNIRITALAFVIPILFVWPACARAQAAKAPYPVMAPLDQYLILDEKAETGSKRRELHPAASSAPSISAGSSGEMGPSRTDRSQIQ
jgi:hypothetical protein